MAKGKALGDKDAVTLPYLRVANVQDGYVDLREVSELEVAASEVTRYLLRKNDVLMNEGGDNDKLGRGAVWQGQLDPCIHQNHVFAVRLTNPELAEWVSRFTSTDAARTYFYLRSKQSTNLASINQSDVRELPVPMPPDDERTAIANFVDEQTARIDALIGEKERLLGALSEWHAAELTRHCFGSDYRQVSTGNPWIPSLPDGWKAMRLKHLVTGIEQGWSPECEARLAEAEEWGVLKAGAANGGVYRETEHKALPSNLEPIAALEVKPGDVLITRASGTADYVGSFAFVYRTRPLLMLSDKNFRLRFAAAPRVPPELLAWSANTYAVRQQILQYVSGADGLAKNIGSGSLREVWFPVPPKQEQAEILERLRKSRENAVAMEQHLEEHIARLREFRYSLISAAVTGQLDISTQEDHAPAR